MRWTMEVVMHMSPHGYISILLVQIHLQTQVSNPQLVYMGKQQLGVLLGPASVSVTSQRIQYSQMPYQAQSAGASRIIT